MGPADGVPDSGPDFYNFGLLSESCSAFAESTDPAVLLGYTDHTTNGGIDFLAYKVNSNGVEKAHKNFGGPLNGWEFQERKPLTVSILKCRFLKKSGGRILQ